MSIEQSEWDKSEVLFKSKLETNTRSNEDSLQEIFEAIYFFSRERLKARLTEPGFDFDSQQYLPTEQLLAEDDNTRFKLVGPSEAVLRKRNRLLLVRFINGDQKALNEFYEIEFPKVVRMVLRNNGDVENAKDIFQDAMVVLIEKSLRGNLDLDCYLGTYVYSVCRFLWMNQLRKNNKRSRLEPEDYSHYDWAVPTEIEPVPDEKIEVAIRAIDRLGENCKVLLEYYYYQNLSWVEISKRMGYLTAASARNQKYKCLERIRQILLAQ